MLYLVSRGILLILAIALFTYLIVRVYVWLPLSRWGKGRQARSVQFETCTVTELPEKLAAQHNVLSQQLVGAGFVSTGLRKPFPRLSASTISYVNLLFDTHRDVAVQLIAVEVRVKAISLQSVVATLSTRFEDGTGIVTSNSMGGRLLPRDSTCDVTHLPGADAASLLLFHREWVARMRGNRVTEKLKGDIDPDAFLQNGVREAHEFFVRSGYYRADPSTDEVALTLHGAFGSTLRALPPAKGWIRRFERRRSLKRLKQCGFRTLHDLRYRAFREQSRRQSHVS